MTAARARDRRTARTQTDDAARRARRIATINRIGRLIGSTLRLDEMLQTVVGAICDDLHFVSLGICLVDPDDPETLVLHAKAGVHAPLVPDGYRQGIHQGILGEAVRARRRLLVDDVAADPRYIPTPGATDICAELAVPILAGDQVLGAFNVESSVPISEEDAADLEVIADQLGIAIQNARLFDAAQRRAARMATINRVGRLITSSLSLGELLPTAVAAMAEHLHYPTIALMLVDPEDPETLVLHSRSGVYSASELDAYRQSIHEGIAGAAARTRRLLLINDVRNDPRYIPVSAGHDLRAELAIPLVVGEQLVGLLNIESEGRITEEDAADFEVIADQLAVAIENARLFEAQQRRAARTAIINRIGRLISGSLSLEAILQTAVESVYEQLGYASVSVLLLDPDDQETLVMRARDGRFGRGLPPGGYRQRLDRGILGVATRERRHVLIDDVRHDPRYVPIPGGEAIRSELAAPLLAGDRLLGVLNIESERRIAEDDVADIAIVADQLAVAIDNAYRYDDERRRTERLSLIARVGQRITARLDPDALFSTTVEELHVRLGYDHVSLFLVDPADPGWIVQRARASRWPRGEAVGYRQRVTEGILGAAAMSCRPELVNDIASDPRFIAVPHADDMRAELAVPILRGARLLGVLDVAGRRPLREEDITGVQVVADQLATAIENANLFAGTQQALDDTRLLYETSRRIGAAASIDDVVQVYLELVAARQRYACSVGVYETNEAGDRVAVRVLGRWTPEDGIIRREQRFPRTDDDLDPPLDAGQTVTIVDVHTDPRASDLLRAIQREDGRPALALIPLMARGQRIGVVVLADPTVHDWPEGDLHPYQVTAAQLATAIDSRRQQLTLLEQAGRLAVLGERQRLARELHDSVTQLVFSVTLIAQTLGSAWRRDPQEGERRVTRLLELSRSALAELRALLTELRPPSADPAPAQAEGTVRAAVTVGERLRREGLALMLGRLAVEAPRDGPRVRVDANGYAALAPEAEEALYRIAAEAMNNALKHAAARTLEIRLTTDGTGTRLTVSDDGSGFAATPEGQAGSVPSRRGLGMFTMRERAEAFGGSVRIISGEGRGTTVEVLIPSERPATTDDQRGARTPGR